MRGELLKLRAACCQLYAVPSSKIRMRTEEEQIRGGFKDRVVQYFVALHACSAL